MRTTRHHGKRPLAWQTLESRQCLSGSPGLDTVGPPVSIELNDGACWAGPAATPAGPIAPALSLMPAISPPPTGASAGRPDSGAEFPARGGLTPVEAYRGTSPGHEPISGGALVHDQVFANYDLSPAIDLSAARSVEPAQLPASGEHPL